MFSWVMGGKGWGASCPGWFILPPTPEFQYRIDNTQILLHHLLQEYLVERDGFHQSEMLTQTFFGLRIDKGWGASCPGRFILSPPPPPRNFTMEIHYHLLQEYLAERDINFISVNLRCLLTSNYLGVDGKLVQGGLSCPLPRISERMDIANFITPSSTGIFSWKGISVNLRSDFKCSVGLRIH